jgi:hypothetical protein
MMRALLRAFWWLAKVLFWLVAVLVAYHMWRNGAFNRLH